VGSAATVGAGMTWRCQGQVQRWRRRFSAFAAIRPSPHREDPAAVAADLMALTAGYRDGSLESFEAFRCASGSAVCRGRVDYDIVERGQVFA